MEIIHIDLQFSAGTVMKHAADLRNGGKCVYDISQARMIYDTWLKRKREKILQVY